MEKRKLRRRILQWVGGFVAWYVYGVVLLGLSVHSSISLYVVLALWMAPILLLLWIWIDIQGPAELRKAAGERLRSLVRRK